MLTCTLSLIGTCLKQDLLITPHWISFHRGTYINSLPSLPTRAFALLRKWMKNGSLNESETHELVEIQTDLPVESFRSEIKTLNRKFTFLLWMVGILGTLFGSSIISLLVVILSHLLNQS